MNKTDFLKNIDELLELEAGTLKGDELLSDFDFWDSLALVSLDALANKSFGISLDRNELIAAKRVSDILEMVNL